MNALAKTDYAPWSLSEAVVSDFTRRGLHLFEEPLPARACAELLAGIGAGRRFDQTLFQSEAEAKQPPKPTRTTSLLTRLEPRLAFVERAPQIVEALWSLLGPDYRIIDKAVVCALPAAAIPDWLRRRDEGPMGDLSAWLRPEARDIVFTWGEDYHQDLLDQRIAPAEIVTLHVNLQAVTESDGPVHLLEGSHRMGAAAVPHDLKRTGPDSWRYRSAGRGEMYVTERVLTGEAGSVALWHACTLNAAARAAEQPQIALRYRIARGAARTAGIDGVNASLAGPLSRD